MIDVPSTLDICYNYYRKASLPNMYGDKVVETAKQRFLPFYPLVHTFCSSELETFLCSVFFPRYDQVTFINQKPCRKACERVYRSCKYAIGRSNFFWPPELECGKFLNDATCYSKFVLVFTEEFIPIKLTECNFLSIKFKKIFHQYLGQVKVPGSTFNTFSYKAKNA